MSNIELALAGAGGLALGVAVGIRWARRQGAAPTAPASRDGAPPKPAAPPASPFDIHLVLNCLNHLAIAVAYDDRGQEGVATLADYLRSACAVVRHPSARTLEEAVDAYWSCVHWLRGRSVVAIAWSCDDEAMEVGDSALAGRIVAALAPLSDADLTTLAIHRGPRPQSPGAGAIVRITASGAFGPALLAGRPAAVGWEIGAGRATFSLDSATDET